MQIDYNFIIMILGAILPAAVTWGVFQTKVRKLEDEVIALRVGANKDRDLLVEIKTKIDLLLSGKLITLES